ncbi:hypothetical protein HPB47_013468, partial [Ixodes persulcatus]
MLTKPALRKCASCDLRLLMFHLKRGATISVKQANKIFNPKAVKAKVAAKKTAQALWGLEGLAERSFSGKVAPKDRKDPNAEARKELTPEKVCLVIETASHWGLVKSTDVSETLANLSTVLSEKIQDVRKQFKRRAL